MQVNTQIQAIKPSATLEITGKAKAMKRAGEDVVGFGAGEPDFDTPDHIKAAAIEAINNGVTKYAPNPGTPELRAAVSHRFSEDYSLQYAVDQVLVSNGAKQSIYNLLRTILEPGEEVLVPAPYWVSYPDMVKLSGGVPVAVRAGQDQGFRVSVEQLQAAVTPRTRGIILNNPSNPTGTGYSRAELEKIAAFVVKNDLWVISDEIYDKLIYDDHVHTAFATLSEDIYARTATVNGVSKAYSMTGWRVGWAAGPVEWIKAAAKLQGQSTSAACSISQAAATAALTGDQGVITTMLVQFDKRRRRIVELLNAIEGVSCITPQGAFYVFPSIAGALGPYENDLQWAGALLENQKVALVPGTPFDAPGHVRLSYATSMEDIEKGLERINTFVRTNCT